MNTEYFYEGPGASSYTTYIWEIALILAIAFILGYLLRAMLNGSYKDRIMELDHENSILKSRSAPQARPVDVSGFENTIKEQNIKINELNDKLSECYGKKIKAENALKLAEDKLTSVTKEEPKASIVSSVASPSPVVVKTEKVVVSENMASEKDNLKKIEGVGPKIEQLLNADGINSFIDLKNADVDRVKGVLIAAGPNYAVHDPSTWSEQANLASKGKWEELDAMQEELKGGKRK